MQVLVNISTCVVTEVTLTFTNLLNNYSAFLTSVGTDLTERLFDGTLDDVDTGCFVGIVAFQTFQRFQCTDVSYA